MAYNDWLDIEVLEDYLDGKLDAKEMYQVEKLSLEDPFVAQALEGLAASKKRTYHLSLLQKQLQERLQQKPVERKMWRLTSHRLSIAATAAVVFISVSILFWMRETNRQKQAELAANKPKNIEVNLAPQTADIPENQKSENESQIVPEKVQAELDHTLKNKSGALARNNKQTDKKQNDKDIAPLQDMVTVAEPMAAQAKRAMVKPEIGVAAMSSPVALSVPKTDSISSKPQPLNGWAAYQIYLTEQNRVSKNQELGKTVELHFLIDKNGLPAKIEITKSAGAQLDNEAVRLVKEGSKWNYIEGTPNQVILKVQF